MGTAFDYLLRFYIERLNEVQSGKKWLAEEVVEMVSEAPRFHRECESLLKTAKRAHSRFMKSGKIGDSLLLGACYLAHLDMIYRTGYSVNLDVCDQNDLKDLGRLISLVEPSLFKADWACLLNPTFGKASRLVGGADADLVIDDALIEVKTIKELKFDTTTFYQLAGYYILYQIGGFEGYPKGRSIERLGVYYSRYGLLKRFPAKCVFGSPGYDRFVEWFVHRAKEEMSHGTTVKE